MRRHFRHCFSNCLPIILLLPLTLLPLTLLPLTPATAQSMGGNGLDSYGYDSGGTYHGSNYGSSPNYLVSGPSDADMAKLQSHLQNDFAFLDHHNDPPPRRWSDDYEHTPPPAPPPAPPVSTYWEDMQAKADAGDKKALENMCSYAVITKDFPRAVRLLQKSSDGGNKAATIDLYDLLVDKENGVQDLLRAAKMLPMLADFNPHFRDLYGRALLAGDYLPKDAVQGLSLREDAAAQDDDKGYESIAYDLARDFDTGNGITQNPDRACLWYMETAESPHWVKEERIAAASRACELMLSQKNGLHTYRDDIVSLLAGRGAIIPLPDRRKLAEDLAKLLAPGEPAPDNPATAAGLLLVNKGLGTPNYAEAIKHFTECQNLPSVSEPNDDLIALHQLGLIYEHGLGVPRDHDKAMTNFNMINTTYGDACYYRAVDFFNRWQAWIRSPNANHADIDGDISSENEAERGANLGDVPSKRLFAEWTQYCTEQDGTLSTGTRMEQYRKAYHLWKEASAAGDVQSTYFLGAMAEAGEGAPKNLVAAAKFYRQASDAGDVDAQERYAGYMMTGKGGVPKDTAGGQALLEKAAENSPQAANAVAVLLWHGPDPKSHRVAIKKWLQKSFDDGYWVAGRNLAKYYHIGLGGTKDEAQARDYLEKAAVQGGKNGAKVAMDAYTKGDCVNVDPAAAARWKVAAARWDPPVYRN